MYLSLTSVILSSTQDQALISQVMAENDCLCQEKMRLLEQLQEHEEANRSSKHILFLAQNR